PDELALPHDLDRPQLAAERARRHAHADDLGRADRRAVRAHRRPPDIACMIIRLLCLPEFSSASRMDEPVKDMKTSSSVGRETFTARIGSPRSANSRGTNSSPDGTKK